MAVLGAARVEDSERIGRAGAVFLALAGTVVLALGLTLGAYLVQEINAGKAAAVLRHAARIDPNHVEPGRTAATMRAPEGASPSEVKVGVYIDRVTNVSVRDSVWEADFYAWFHWSDNTLSPGGSFQVTDGEITSKEKVSERDENGERYELYRVSALVTKFFDVSRFPQDDHLMTLTLEDADLQWDKMIYVVDEGASSISSRVQIPGYSIYKTGQAVKPHAYRTTRGDPTIKPGTQATYASFVYGFGIKRPDLALVIKMFQGLFCAVALAMVAFFIKPSDVDPRFGLGVGGFFGALANAYLTAGMVPDSGVRTQADTLNAIGIGVIFLCVVQSAASLYIWDRMGNEALSKAFDKVGFAVIGSVYVGLTFSVIRAAVV